MAPRADAIGKFIRSGLGPKVMVAPEATVPEIFCERVTLVFATNERTVDPVATFAPTAPMPTETPVVDVNGSVGPDDVLPDVARLTGVGSDDNGAIAVM